MENIPVTVYENLDWNVDHLSWCSEGGSATDEFNPDRNLAMSDDSSTISHNSDMNGQSPQNNDVLVQNNEDCEVCALKRHEREDATMSD